MRLNVVISAAAVIDIWINEVEVHITNGEGERTQNQTQVNGTNILHPRSCTESPNQHTSAQLGYLPLTLQQNHTKT